MKVPIFVLAACLGLAATLPVDDVAVDSVDPARNSLIEQMILNQLEGLRESMVSGSEDMPVLDPFQLDYMHMELDTFGLEGGHMTIESVEARKLSTFVIDNLRVRMRLPTRFTIELEGHVPVIEVDTAAYDMKFNVMGGDIFGTGSAKLRIIEPRITATLDVNYIPIVNTGSIRDAKVFFTLGAFKPEINGMFDNPMVDDFLNTFLSYLVEDVVAGFQDEISEVLSKLVKEVGSDLIGGNLRKEDIPKNLQLQDLLKKMLQDLSKKINLQDIPKNKLQPGFYQEIASQPIVA